MAVFGYARISRPTQKIDRQIKNILQYNNEANIIQEAYTGARIDRPAWNKLCGRLRCGDTVIFDSVSRMSRNAQEGVNAYESLFNSGINLVFIKEPHINTAVYREAIARQIQITTNTGNAATDEFIGAVIDALNKYSMALAREQIALAFAQAQKEIDDLHKRTSEGLKVAKDGGKRVGRQLGDRVETKKGKAAKEFIYNRSIAFGGNLSDSECIKLCDISRNSFYKYKRELREEKGI